MDTTLNYSPNFDIKKRKAKEIDEYQNSTKAEDQNINEGDVVWARNGNLKGKYVVKNGIKGIENKDGFHVLDAEGFRSMERRIPNSEKVKQIKNENNKQRTNAKDTKNPENTAKTTEFKAAKNIVLGK